ncbi:MAG: ABC transporter permease subunit [Rhodothermales bacterium]|nr:ABC transporter permease subunit [Rhodothermales bacterium]
MQPLKGSLLLTVRELWAMKITQGVFVVATIGWLLLSFAMNLDVVEGSISALRIFGLESTPSEAFRDPETGEIMRRSLGLDEFLLGVNQFVFGLCYFFGTLLGLFATMPLIGGFLEEGRIDLYLSKPVSRTRLLAGHVIGVWLTVLVLVTYLILAVWLVLSLKTGSWRPDFLVTIPIITIMFGVMYSVVMTLSIIVRSSGLSLVVAYGLIFFSILFAAHEQLIPVLGATTGGIFRLLYFVLPNFVEVMQLVSQLVSDQSVTDLVPLLSSILFGGTTYVIGFVWFSRRDF